MALKYQVAILNVWWNRGEVDTRLFYSKSDRDLYFNGLNPYWNSLNNFNIRDNITTTIVFRDDSGRTIDELLKCNYAIVRHLVGENTYTYRYYYIVNVEQDSNNQIICTIDLDDVQNNLYDLINQNNPIYVKNWTGFNYKSNGWINFYPLNLPKQMASSGDSPTLYNTNSQRIKVKQYEDESLDNWLYNNIYAWRYVYCVQNNSLCRPRNDVNDKTTILLSTSVFTTINGNSTGLPYCAVSEPIYSGDKKIYVKYNVNNVDYYLKLESVGIEAFFNVEDTDYSNFPMGTYGFCQKYSILAPFGTISNYEIDADGDLIITANITPFTDYNIVISLNQFYRTALNMPQYANTSKATAERGIVGGIDQRKTTYDAVAENPITINDVGFASMKILDLEYTKLRVRVANQSYDYNPLALLTDTNASEIGFKYTEILKVGINKIYLRAIGNGLYTSAEESNYTGLVASIDITEPILTNQWADYVASNKNYYMQTMYNNTAGLVNSGVSASKSSSQDEAITKGTMTSFNYVINSIERNFEIGNMKLAPNGLSNANGDPYFNLEVSGIAPMLDLYETKDKTKDSIIEKFILQGMTINNLMIPSDVFYSHKNYDAISCTIYLASNISTKEFERLKAYLYTNHRYWYTDTIDFNNPYIK